MVLSSAVNTTVIKDVFIWGGDLDKQIEDALNNEQCTQINIFAGEEWEIRINWHTLPYYSKLRKFASRHPVNILVGCHQTDLHKQNFVAPPEAWIHYWPTHWIHHTADKLKNIVYPKQLPPRKLFLSLNNKAHPHRCMMMDYLEKNNLFEHGDVSWHEKNVHYDFKWWKMKTMILDHNYPQLVNSYNTLPQGFSDTFISLIAEANMKAHFVTEKTWMPIFFKRPFIIFGPQGIHREISYLGFKMFNEIIDYHFDTIENQDKRCQAIMDQLKLLANRDLNQLKKIIKPKLEHNYKLARKIAFDQSYIPAMVKDLCQRYQTDHTIQPTYYWVKSLTPYIPKT
jgi:hypothetical protein